MKESGTSPHLPFPEAWLPVLEKLKPVAFDAPVEKVQVDVQGCFQLLKKVLAQQELQLLKERFLGENKPQVTRRKTAHHELSHFENRTLKYLFRETLKSPSFLQLYVKWGELENHLVQQWLVPLEQQEDPSVTDSNLTLLMRLVSHMIEKFGLPEVASAAPPAEAINFLPRDLNVDSSLWQKSFDRLSSPLLLWWKKPLAALKGWTLRHPPHHREGVIGCILDRENKEIHVLSPSQILPQAVQWLPSAFFEGIWIHLHQSWMGHEAESGTQRPLEDLPEQQLLVFHNSLFKHENRGVEGLELLLLYLQQLEVSPDPDRQDPTTEVLWQNNVERQPQVPELKWCAHHLELLHVKMKDTLVFLPAHLKAHVRLNDAFFDRILSALNELGLLQLYAITGKNYDDVSPTRKTDYYLSAIKHIKRLFVQSPFGGLDSVQSVSFVNRLYRLKTGDMIDGLSLYIVFGNAMYGKTQPLHVDARTTICADGQDHFVVEQAPERQPALSFHSYKTTQWPGLFKTPSATLQIKWSGVLKDCPFGILPASEKNLLWSSSTQQSTQTLLDLMHKRVGHPISLQEMATLMNLSPSHLMVLCTLEPSVGMTQDQQLFLTTWKPFEWLEFIRQDLKKQGFAEVHPSEVLQAVNYVFPSVFQIHSVQPVHQSMKGSSHESQEAPRTVSRSGPQEFLLPTQIEPVLDLPPPTNLPQNPPDKITPKADNGNSKIKSHGSIVDAIKEVLEKSDIPLHHSVILKRMKRTTTDKTLSVTLSTSSYFHNLGKGVWSLEGKIYATEHPEVDWLSQQLQGTPVRSAADIHWLAEKNGIDPERLRSLASISHLVHWQDRANGEYLTYAEYCAQKTRQWLRKPLESLKPLEPAVVVQVMRTAYDQEDWEAIQNLAQIYRQLDFSLPEAAKDYVLIAEAHQED